MKLLLKIQQTVPVCLLVAFLQSTPTLGETTKAVSSGAVVASTLPPITAVAIDQRNAWSIEGSQLGLVIRSWPELKQLRNLPTQLEHIHDIALSPDGTMLVAAGGSPAESGAAELYRWPSGELWQRLEPHQDLIYSVAWRSDSKQFALASADTNVTTYDSVTAECVAVLSGHSRAVLAAEYLPNELGIVTSGVDESLRFWDLIGAASTPAVPKRTFTNHTRQVVGLALRPANPTAPPVIASIGEDTTVRLWQPTIGRMMRFAKLASAPQAVCWVNDGKLLAVACRDGRVRIVDPDSVAVTAELDAIAGAAYCLAADSTGKLLVGGASGQLKLLSSLASASPDAAAEDSVAEDSVAESSSASQPGFKAVELLRDQWGIPHVFAATDEGAMYGLGYASAEDRGFQMHYNLRQIQGRMAEVFGNRPMTAGGESTLHMDRRMRTIGYYRSATAVAQKLDKRTKSLLAAYCQGVNHWFAQHPERAHPFFEKFGLEREPWTPADCIASHWFLGQFFAGDGLDELANRRANLAGAPGPPAANFIVDEAASIVKRKDVSDNWVKAVESYAATLKLPQPVPAAHDGPKFSHAWVVGGSRTTSGKSVLVGDPQTPILNPSLFYEFHVCGDTINSRGIAAPGTPGIMIGWTEHFAWSVTALGADQADLFRLETDRDHPNQYKLDGVWRDMQLHREKIFVKDGSPEELTVRLTHFGPVVSSIADRLDSEAEVALRRVPLSITDSETIQGFFGMMTAKTMPEFTQALAYWSFPSTNLVFGNRDGDIGYWLQAGIPARPSADDKHHGQATADGSLSSNDWRGLVPHALLPHVINPSDGWIASGNHRAIESFYPIRTGVGKGSNGHSIRSFRLYERLAEKAKFQSRDVLDMHFDMTNPGRRIVVRAGLHLRDQQRAQLSQEAQLAIDELRPWHAAGAKLDLGQRGAALAGQIPLEFRTHVTPLAEEFGGGQGGLVKWLRDIDQRLDQGPAVVLSEAEVRFVDGALAAGWKKSQAAFGADPAQWNRRASAESQKQMRGYMNHMNNLGSLDTAYDLPTPELFCIDGTTIRSQGSQAYTQYVPFDDLDRAQSLLPPGNSERPDSPWRTATAEIWARGELHPAPLSRSAVEQISTLKIKLN